ncbi:MAG TPA: hypothetical protein VL200_11080 [Lacunisphaera sp.]|jgi:hypothetical protein|nr:hypothetical protein [Lacunisphaera sp.]
MRIPTVWAVVAASFLLAPGSAPADEIQDLRQQLRQMQADFEKTRQQQQQQIDELSRKLAALMPAAPAAKPAGGNDLEQQLAAELSAAAPPTTADAAPPPATVSAGARPGSAYMNLSYGAALDAGWSSVKDPSAFLQLGDHDPIKRGFALRNAEIAVDGAVDPYFKGFSNIVLKLDKNNETAIELEESFLESTSLPANLQLKAGQYFAAFGRQNPQHPHMWSFADAPLVLNRMFGPDGLRSLGAQVSWLAPTPFYTEVFLSVLDGEGGTAFSFRNPGEPDERGVSRFAGRATVARPLQRAQDLLLVPRIASSFDLSDTQTLLAGLSGAFGPNDTGPHARTSVYGADLYWKWKPTNATQGFPFLAWQSEALYRRFEAGQDLAAGLPAEILRDYGFYSQLVYGFKPRWNAGFRVDYVDGNSGMFDPGDPFRGRRWRFSPEVTFLPSEFSKVRLQFNRDHGEAFGDANSVWMQLEFGLGAHAAHKY